ncbi:hypothetical protein EJ04DRAFT_260993 [Polyplosphaeria fusca]|uniref:PHD-type domain-containing protein n=1 Tax=Polyplosphaeria fusca TaxID=682080 RepID=A0A9P4V6K9_9PLEO|nr:hypothetical protein EJ04DRAFT_260993 [Polyplosphaeria fusca]
MTRKRGRDEMEAEEPREPPTTLARLRNMWQFANLMQYINLFRDAVKIDPDFDIDDLESECLKPEPSEKLAQIGLALLKHVSSHKGLTLEIFDEYAKRQYAMKAPDRNPFGTNEFDEPPPVKFNDFDTFTKIRVLQQLSLWTLNNPNSIRERLNETDQGQALWRMEPLGWDDEDRQMYVLDDNRLYRLAPPAPPPPPKSKPKAKSKKSKGTRASKRRRTDTPDADDPVEDGDETLIDVATATEDDGLGGATWECVCITHEEYLNYLGDLKRSRDKNAKALRERLLEQVMPVIESAAEEQAKKEARRLKEWQVMQQLATAKRSSRISKRVEAQKEQEAADDAERKRKANLAMAKREDEKRQHMDEDRESRMMTREQRLKERETKRILHEEELRKLTENSEQPEASVGRMSERHLKTEMRKREQELAELQKEDDHWVFDCEVCGKHGQDLDDGSGIIACDTCNIWQHLKCHRVSKQEADREDFSFVCRTCKKKLSKGPKSEDPKLPPLKFKLNSSPSSSASRNGQEANGMAHAATPRRVQAVAIPGQPAVPQHPTPQHVQQSQSLMNGPSLSPRGQALGPPGIHRSEAAYGSPYNRLNGSSPPAAARPTSADQTGGIPYANGFPVSSPPDLQSPYAPSTPFTNHLSRPQTNGNPFVGARPYPQPQYPPPYGTSFNRPASSGGAPTHGSPVKHSPIPSPQPANGLTNHPFINSPHSSFPPTSSTPRPSYSPVKNSSPPPPVPHMSSPGLTPHFAPSPNQMPAQMLPHPIPAPEKHDGLRPMSSHSLSETPVLPPIKSLSPSAAPPNLSPPTKKAEPTPERPHFALVSGNGHGMPPAL